MPQMQWLGRKPQSRYPELLTQALEIYLDHRKNKIMESEFARTQTQRESEFSRSLALEQEKVTQSGKESKANIALAQAREDRANQTLGLDKAEFALKEREYKLSLLKGKAEYGQMMAERGGVALLFAPGLDWRTKVGLFNTAARESKARKIEMDTNEANLEFSRARVANMRANTQILLEPKTKLSVKINAIKAILEAAPEASIEELIRLSGLPKDVGDKMIAEFNAREKRDAAAVAAYASSQAKSTFTDLNPLSNYNPRIEKTTGGRNFDLSATDKSIVVADLDRRFREFGGIASGEAYAKIWGMRGELHEAYNQILLSRGISPIPMRHLEEIIVEMAGTDTMLDIAKFPVTSGYKPTPTQESADDLLDKETNQEGVNPEAGIGGIPAIGDDALPPGSPRHGERTGSNGIGGVPATDDPVTNKLLDRARQDFKEMVREAKLNNRRRLFVTP